MQLKYNMAFAKTKIICHGARATRIGERLLRHIWNNIQGDKKDKIFNLFSIISIINYPEDLEKIDTGCDKIIQIVYGNSQTLNYAIQLSQEKFVQKQSDLIIIGSIEQKIENITYINIEESKIIDTFLDILKNYQ